MNGLVIAILMLLLHSAVNANPAPEEPEPVPAKPPPEPEPEPEPLELPDNFAMLVQHGGAYMSFNGKVTGNKGGWRYEGKSFKGTYHYCNGPASISCTFKGDPEDRARPDSRMDCTLTWENVRDGKPEAWVMLLDGKFEGFWYNTGEFKGWTWGGHTREYEADRKTFKNVPPGVTLRGAEATPVYPVTKKYEDECLKEKG